MRTPLHAALITDSLSDLFALHIPSLNIISYLIMSRHVASYHLTLPISHCVCVRLVSSREGANAVLLAAGFEEKGDYFLLGREDPGLLYLVDSVLEQSISVMVN